MPIGEIIADVRSQDIEGGTAPNESSVQTNLDEQNETTMRTGRMLPPYLHFQNVGDDSRSLVAMLGSTLSIVGLVLFWM